MDPFFNFKYPEKLMDRAAWTKNEQRAFQKLQRLVILYDTGFHHDAGMAWLAEQITKYTYELRNCGFRKNKKPPKFPGTGELMKRCFLKFGGRKECLEKYLKEKEEDDRKYLPQNPDDLVLVNGYYFPKMDQEFRVKCKVAEFLCNIM